jgi:hypothetical protein
VKVNLTGPLTLKDGKKGFEDIKPPTEQDQISTLNKLNRASRLRKKLAFAPWEDSPHDEYIAELLTQFESLTIVPQGNLKKRKQGFIGNVTNAKRSKRQKRSPRVSQKRKPQRVDRNSKRKKASPQPSNPSPTHQSQENPTRVKFIDDLVDVSSSKQRQRSRVCQKRKQNDPLGVERNLKRKKAPSQPSNPSLVSQLEGKEALYIRSLFCYLMDHYLFLLLEIPPLGVGVSEKENSDKDLLDSNCLSQKTSGVIDPCQCELTPGVQCVLDSAEVLAMGSLGGVTGNSWAGGNSNPQTCPQIIF